MADNPFEQAFGSPAQKASPAQMGTPAQSSDRSTNPFEATFGSPTKQKEAPPEERAAKAKNDAYEQRIQSWMPEAQKTAKDMGTIGAVGQGITNIPIIGPAVSALGRYAAASSGAGYEKLAPEENTFSNRLENIRAWQEAQNRAYHKESPVLTTGSEIAGSFFLPVGGIAGAFGKGAEALGAGKALTGAAQVAGLGTEAGLYGAGSAAAEKAFGTKPESEQPSIGGSAAMGAGLGVGLGTAGKAIGAAASHMAPEWLKSLGSFDNRLADAAKKDIAAGNVRMTPQEASARVAEGQPVMVADMYGPEFKGIMQKALYGRPDIANDLNNALTSRIQDQGSRFDTFIDKLRNSGDSPAEILQTAQKVARDTKDQIYAKALSPGNGAGSWDASWDNMFNNKAFRAALEKTEENMREELSSRGIDPVNYVSPFRNVTAMDPKTGAAYTPTISGTNIPQIETIMPHRIDVNFVDNLQRNLNTVVKGGFGPEYTPQGSIARNLMDFRKSMVNELADPAGKFYNPEYAKARQAAVEYRDNSDAFTYGNQLLSKVRNAADASKIELETRGMSPQERELATQGLLTTMRAKVMRGDGTINTNTLNTYFNPGPVRDAMQNILLPNQFNHLERFIKTEAIMNNTLKESQKFGKGRPNDPEMRSLMYALFDYKLAGARFLGTWYSRYRGDKYAQQLVDKFSSGDPKDFNDVYNTIMKNPGARKSLGQYVFERAARPADIGAAMMGRAEGGPVEEPDHKAVGGMIGMPPMRRSMQGNIISSAANKLIKAAGSQPTKMPEPNMNFARGGRVYAKGGRIKRAGGGDVVTAGASTSPVNVTPSYAANIHPVDYSNPFLNGFLHRAGINPNYPQTTVGAVRAPAATTGAATGATGTTTGAVTGDAANAGTSGATGTSGTSTGATTAAAGGVDPNNQQGGLAIMAGLNPAARIGATLNPAQTEAVNAAGSSSGLAGAAGIAGATGDTGAVGATVSSGMMDQAAANGYVRRVEGDGGGDGTAGSSGDAGSVGGAGPSDTGGTSTSSSSGESAGNTGAAGTGPSSSTAPSDTSWAGGLASAPGSNSVVSTTDFANPSTAYSMPDNLSGNPAYGSLSSISTPMAEANPFGQLSDPFASTSQSTLSAANPGATGIEGVDQTSTEGLGSITDDGTDSSTADGSSDGSGTGGEGGGGDGGGGEGGGGDGGGGGDARGGYIGKGHTLTAKRAIRLARKRSTGGRIPEMDRLFKQAKKYVDSQTKTILREPDDAVAKALHIAKRKI